jgi:predicted Zn-dependent protease
MRAYGVANRRRFALAGIAAILASVAAIAGCHESDIEETLGRSTARNIESTFGVVKDPLVADWTTSLGQQVVEVSTRNNIPYEFKVLDTDMVNAFAAPYGYVYFTRGILDFVDREDELAFVMGHEVGHIVGRHSIAGLKRQFWMSVLFSLWNTKKYDDLKNVAGLVAVFGLLRYDRKQEYEADRYGIEYALAAGYDPIGGAEFFRRLEEENGRPSALEVYFLTHPPTDRRINAVQTAKQLDPANAQAMVAIGEGYARRGQYRRAAERFRQAVAADSRSLEGHLGLAQAMEALGDFEQAAQEYRRVLRLDEGNRLAQRGVERLQAGGPVVLAGQADAQAIAQARESVEAGSGPARDAPTAVRLATSQEAEGLTASRRTSREATGALLGLADIARDAEGISADLVNQADLALRGANESLYGLERADSAAIDAARRLTDSVARAQDRLANPEGLDAWQVASLREVGRLAERGGQALRRLPELRPDALGAVRNAQRVAGNVVTRVGESFKRGAAPSVLDTVRGMTDQARDAGERARGKVDDLARHTNRARTDALLAQIDALAATAPRAMLPACDQMVAYYFRAQPDEVRTMREDGRTYGQIALSLAGRGSLGDWPTSEGRGGALELVESLDRRGVDLGTVNVFLKFLANALEAQTAPEA